MLRDVIGTAFAVVLFVPPLRKGRWTGPEGRVGGLLASTRPGRWRSKHPLASGGSAVFDGALTWWRSCGSRVVGSRSR